MKMALSSSEARAYQRSVSIAGWACPPHPCTVQLWLCCPRVPLGLRHTRSAINPAVKSVSAVCSTVGIKAALHNPPPPRLQSVSPLTPQLQATCRWLHLCCMLCAVGLGQERLTALRLLARNRSKSTFIETAAVILAILASQRQPANNSHSQPPDHPI